MICKMLIQCTVYWQLLDQEDFTYISCLTRVRQIPVSGIYQYSPVLVGIGIGPYRPILI